MRRHYTHKQGCIFTDMLNRRSCGGLSALFEFSILVCTLRPHYTPRQLLDLVDIWRTLVVDGVTMDTLLCFPSFFQHHGRPIAADGSLFYLHLAWGDGCLRLVP